MRFCCTFIWLVAWTMIGFIGLCCWFVRHPVALELDEAIGPNDLSHNVQTRRSIGRLAFVIAAINIVCLFAAVRFL